MAKGGGGIIRRLLLAVGVKSDEQGFEKVKKGAEEVKNTLLAIVGAAAAVTGALGALVATETAAAREAGNLAASLGYTIRDFTRLSGAASMVGIETDDLADAIATLADRAEDAKAGVTSMADDFRLVGLSVEDLRGKKPSELFDLFAEAIASTDDPGKRMTAIVRTLGDDVGRRLSPMLMRGTEGIRALADEAERAGLVIDEAALEESRKLSEEWARLTSTTKGLARGLAFDLMPKVRELVTSVREWIYRNREWINQKIEAVVDVISNALDNAIPIAWAFAAALGAIAAVGLVAWANPVGIAVLAIVAAFTLAYLAVEDLAFALDGDPNDSLIGTFANAVGAGDSLRAMLDELRPLLEEVRGLFHDLGFAAGEGEEEVSGLAAAFRDFVGILSSEVFETIATEIREITDSVRAFRALLTGDTSGIQRKQSVGASIRGSLPFGAGVGLGLGARAVDATFGTDVSSYFDPTPAASTSTSKSTSISFGGVNVNANGLGPDEARRVVREEIETATRRALDAAGGGS